MPDAHKNHASAGMSHRTRRAEGFAVRRWLQLGAASAGMGAALLGYSLLGPQVGVAGADSTGTSSAASSASASDGAETDPTDGGTTETATDVDDPEDGDEDVEIEDEVEDIDEAPATEAEVEVDEEPSAEPEPTDSEPAAPAVEDTEPDADRKSTQESDPEPADDTAEAAASVADTEAGQPDSSVQSVTAQLSAPTVPAPRRTWREIVAGFLDEWTADTQAWIDSLDVDDEAKARMEANFFTMRRTFFNQAPIVEPIQLTGKLDGPITGTLDAVDPDGDRVVYRIVRAPREGSLQLNPDGTYTYTPDSDFDGVDTFRVVAVDAGLHVNLLDLFRPIGTRVSPLINQGAIKFDFQFTTGAQYWTEDRRAALNEVADDLVLYFVVGAPVVLSYSVTGMEDAESDTLASAGSSLIRTSAGFWRTVVQNKLLTGVDSNGSAVDGRITWNFGHSWALGEEVGDDEFDFAATAMHELMHSFGFLSLTGEPGDNDNRYWTIFDSFVVTADRVRPINRRYQWDSDFDPYLIGEDGGLYFGGANAVEAYGDLVPLFTPDPWVEGSSGSHLDDFTFTGPDQLMMNANTDTGPGVRVLSALELGILRDLGYQVDPQTPPLATALLGVVFLGRRRRKSAAEHVAQ